MLSKQTTVSLRVFYIIAILSLIWLTYPFAGVITLGILTAYFAKPLYDIVQSKWKSSWISISLTWLVIVLAAVIPITISMLFLANEITTIYDDVSNNTSVNSAISRTENFIKSTSLQDLPINLEGIKDQALGAIKPVVQNIAGWTARIGGSIMSLFTAFVLYLFVTTALLTRGSQLITYIKSILPLDPSITSLYLSRLGHMSGSIVKSTFIIAILQGILTALSFTIVGVPYFVFFAFLTTILAIIPMLGASVIATIVGIVLLATGNIRGGITVILINQIIVNNIDNVLRPKLVDKSAQIDDTLFLIAVFGGLYRGGVAGLLFGPVLMSFVITTFEIVREKLLLKR